MATPNTGKNRGISVEKQDILQQVQEIVRDITDNDDVTLTLDTKAEDVDGWDSVNHIKIILGIESEFGIRFEVDEINQSENVGDLVDLVSSKL